MVEKTASSLREAIQKAQLGGTARVTSFRHGVRKVVRISYGLIAGALFVFGVWDIVSEFEAKGPTVRTPEVTRFAPRERSEVLDLPLGKWVPYRRKESEYVDITFDGEGCVAIAIDDGNILPICMYPEQKPKSWPFEQKMPKPVMYAPRLMGYSYRFMALDEPGAAKMKISW